MFGLNSLENIAKDSQLCSVHRPSVMDGLIEQRKMLAERLAAVDAAIKAMENTPGVKDVLEALAKVGGY